MGYLGNTPGENFITFSKQVFTIVNSQTAYTLDFAVVDENELRLVINNVVQEPGTGKAYTASGTTLTLASALTNGTDEMYCVFLGKARETVTVPTITKDKLNLISNATAGIEIKGDGGSNDGYIQLNCRQNSHGIKLKSPPHSASQSYTLTFPSTAPATDKFLKTDSSGNLSFADAGGGAFTKISTTTISTSVASIDFNTLSTDYRDFRIICSDLRIDTHQQFPILKVKRSGQSSFDGGSNEYIYAMMGYDSDGNEIKAQSTGDNKLKLLPASLARDATVDGANADMIIDCYNVHATDSKFMIGVRNTFIEGTYGRSAGGFGGGYRNALDAIIGIQVAFEGSTQAIAGTVTLYGRKI